MKGHTGWFIAGCADYFILSLILLTIQKVHKNIQIFRNTLIPLFNPLYHIVASSILPSPLFFDGLSE